MGVEKVLIGKGQIRTMAGLIGCVAIYGITISLFTPLLSLILEGRGSNSIVIGGLAMTSPLGVILGSFFVPRCLQLIDARLLLAIAIILEAFLILLLLAFDHLVVWFGIRFCMGITGSFLFTVSESWMNDITPDATRGRAMGIYNTVLLSSFALGPLLLVLTGIEGAVPFLAGIVLVLLALPPLAFIGDYRPISTGDHYFNVLGLIRVAPLLAIACIVIAFTELVMTSLLPVYGVRNGLTEASATLMLFFAALGGALFQVPVGWVADHFNRLVVIRICGGFGILGAIMLPLVIDIPWALATVLFLSLGFFAGIYTVAMALAGQWFRGVELATVMASFGVFWGIGGISGPFVAGLAMDLWDPHGLPATLALIAAIFFIISLVPTCWRPNR